MKIDEYDKGTIGLMIIYSIVLAIFSTFTQFKWFSFLITAGVYVLIKLLLIKLRGLKK